MMPNQVTTMCRVIGTSGGVRHTINDVMIPAARVVHTTERTSRASMRSCYLGGVRL